MVQLHNLPQVRMFKECGERIGSMLGVVEEVAVNEDDIGWGRLLRLKIRLDLTKPLARERKVTINEEKYQIPIQIEKLPRFYFTCGRIIHENGGCMQSSTRNQGVEQFRTELCATLVIRKHMEFSNGSQNESSTATRWREPPSTSKEQDGKEPLEISPMVTSTKGKQLFQGVDHSRHVTIEESAEMGEGEKENITLAESGTLENNRQIDSLSEERVAAVMQDLNMEGRQVNQNKISMGLVTRSSTVGLSEKGPSIDLPISHAPTYVEEFAPKGHNGLNRILKPEHKRGNGS